MEIILADFLDSVVRTVVNLATSQRGLLVLVIVCGVLGIVFLRRD